MKLYTEMDISRIYIVMGLKCNFNCKYCYEKHMKHNDYEVSDKVINYLKRLVELKPFASKKPIHILFWGGEPLLYINVIKKFIDELQGLPFTYGTVSNGFLFTPEIVDYFNNHNIGVAISNDGVNTKLTRNIDILQISQKVDIIKNINNLAIDSVISAYNYNYLQTIDYVYEKINREVPIAFEWLHCDKNTPKELYTIDYDKYELYLDDYFNRINQCVENNITSQFVNDILGEVSSLYYTSNVLEPRCGQMRNTLNLDLQGNIMACHPSTILGSVDSEYSDMVKKYDKEINQAFSFCDCGNCEYLMICKAGCPLELPCDGKLAICKAKRIYFKKFFEYFDRYKAGDNID